MIQLTCLAAATLFFNLTAPARAATVFVDTDAGTINGVGSGGAFNGTQFVVTVQPNGTCQFIFRGDFTVNPGDVVQGVGSNFASFKALNNANIGSGAVFLFQGSGTHAGPGGGSGGLASAGGSGGSGAFATVGGLGGFGGFGGASGGAGFGAGSAGTSGTGGFVGGAGKVGGFGVSGQNGGAGSLGLNSGALAAAGGSRGIGGTPGGGSSGGAGGTGGGAGIICSGTWAATEASRAAPAKPVQAEDLGYSEEMGLPGKTSDSALISAVETAAPAAALAEEAREGVPAAGRRRRREH